MIQGSLFTSTIPSIGYAIKAFRDGKMSLPVSPASYIYSHFKHVSGVPAPEGVRGVAINKLKVLDVLIEQLSQMKTRPMPLSAETQISEEQINALINQYEEQIRQARASSVVIPYIPSPQAPAGVIFNLVA